MATRTVSDGFTITPPFAELVSGTLSFDRLDAREGVLLGVDYFVALNLTSSGALFSAISPSPPTAAGSRPRLAAATASA